MERCRIEEERHEHYSKLILAAGLAAFAATSAVAQDAGMKKWVKGKGFRA
jgi:hypothetical protein